MYKQEQEAEKLVEAFLSGDEDALCKLVNLYKPMIYTIKSRIYLKNLDDEDWYQEAMISCHEAIMAYDKNKGTFGTIYKNYFYNRIMTLLRFEMAVRRRIDRNMVPWTEDIDEENFLVQEPDNLYCTINEVGSKVCQKLTNVEMNAILVMLGKASVDDVLRDCNITLRQLNSARARARRKLYEILFST